MLFFLTVLLSNYLNGDPKWIDLKASSSLSAAGERVTCPGPFMPTGPDPINPADWPAMTSFTGILNINLESLWLSNESAIRTWTCFNILIKERGRRLF